MRRDAFHEDKGERRLRLIEPRHMSWLAIVNLTIASSAIGTKRTCPTDLTMSDIGVGEKWLAGVQYDAIDPLRTFLTNAKIKLHR
jgi:hypothetical protein